MKDVITPHSKFKFSPVVGVHLKVFWDVPVQYQPHTNLHAPEGGSAEVFGYKAMSIEKGPKVDMEWGRAKRIIHEIYEDETGTLYPH